MTGSIDPIFALALTAIELAFAGALGVLLRRARTPGCSVSERTLPILLGLLLFLPGALIMLRQHAWPLILRLALLLSAGVTVWAAYRRPRWIPAGLWQPPRARIALACAMALTAGWELTQTLAGSLFPPAVLALAAGLAGAASLARARAPG